MKRQKLSKEGSDVSDARVEAVFLIDFDFAGKENVRTYPSRFNHYISTGFRHPDAKSGKPLLRIHDLYSFVEFCRIFFTIEGTEKEKEDWSRIAFWPDVVRMVNYDAACEGIHNILIKYGDRKLILTEEGITAFATNAASGSPRKFNPFVHVAACH